MKKTRVSGSNPARPKKRSPSQAASDAPRRRRKPARSADDVITTSAARSPRGSFVAIEDQDVVLLETNNYIGMSGLEDIVFRAFAANADVRGSGAAWLAFGTCGRPHHAGKDSWIGLSRSIPPRVVDDIQADMFAKGLEVERELGRALHLKMNPFARLSDDGLEILVPAALVGDPSAKRMVPRGGVNPVARGYEVKPSTAAALNELFFGKGD